MLDLVARLTPKVLKNQDKKSGSTLLSSRNVKSLVVHVLLLIPASAFFGLWINSKPPTCPFDPLLNYSPVNEVLQYVERQFEGRVDAPSIYRGSPSPEIDDAWGRIRPLPTRARLTYEEFIVADGIDISAAIRYRPEDGGGYLGQLDAYHQLHCLDMIRKDLRPEYYASDYELNNVPRPHLAHCIDMIRQKLMCTADLTMITYDWVPGIDQPRPNLSATHQCVDYERILDWSARHDARVPEDHVVRFGNVTDLPAEPK